MKRAAIAATLACACGPDSTATNDTTTSDASSDGGDTTPNPTTPDPTTSSSDAPDPDTTTTSTSTESTTSTSTDEGSDDVYEEDTGGTGCAFTCPSQPGGGGGGGSFECDVWAQDCPDGEKCMPWANDGGPLWNATRCSPLDDRPAPLGEPCMVEGSGVSGIDDCDIGHMCWDVDRFNEGTCAALCMGSEASPTCPGEDVCLTITDVLSLCQTGCDPLAQDCPDGEACGTSIGAHVCTTAGPAGAGDSCVDLACAEGLVCVDGASIASCETLACCAPYCDPAGAPCPGGANCQPLDVAPDVGVCID